MPSALNLKIHGSIAVDDTTGHKNRELIRGESSKLQINERSNALKHFILSVSEKVQQVCFSMIRPCFKFEALCISSRRDNSKMLIVEVCSQWTQLRSFRLSLIYLAVYYYHFYYFTKNNNNMEHVHEICAYKQIRSQRIGGKRKLCSANVTR